MDSESKNTAQIANFFLALAVLLLLPGLVSGLLWLVLTPIYRNCYDYPDSAALDLYDFLRNYAMYLSIPAVLVACIALKKCCTAKAEGVKISVFVFLIAGIACIYSLLLSEDGVIFKTRHSHACLSRLKQIGLALKQYAMDSNDCFPPENGAAGFEYIRQYYYLTEAKIYTLPGKMVAAAGATLSEDCVAFVYRGGLTEADPPDSAIAWDKPENHKKKNQGHVLFIDGHVTTYHGTNWMSKIR